VRRIHWLSISIFICAVLGILIITDNHTTAQEEPTSTPSYSYIKAEAVRVRAAPSETALSIGTLLKNARLVPYNRDESGNWVLVGYADGFGWIRRDLAIWVEDIDALPILTSDNLTPTPVPRTPSPTPRLVTLTPSGSYVIARVNVYVRTGPGLSFSPLGILTPGSVVEPLNIDETGTWVLIRFSYTPRDTGNVATRVVDGFGWVARNVVLWTIDVNELPILYDDALTPTLTFTPSFTPSTTSSATSTQTATATSTSTSTPTATPTLTATNTDMPTATPTLTATNTDMPTATPTLTATNTDMPTATPTLTATNTDMPTATSTPTATNTDMPTATSTLTATNTDMPTATSTLTATNTDMPTEMPTLAENRPPDSVATSIAESLVLATATNTDVPTATPTLTATNTDMPTATPTLTATNTDVSTETSTLSGQATAIEESSPTSPPSVVGTEVIGMLFASETPTSEAVVAQNPTETPPTITPVDEPPAISTSVPLEAVFAGIVLFIIISYVWMYWRGQSAVDRYAKGFIIEKCPVCRVGELEVETRTVRILGIPRPRRTIRCDNCRSLLRETGMNRWRYAVDKLANIAMYDRYNGLEVDERTLQKLAQNPIEED
jgi:hypothetical protein